MIQFDIITLVNAIRQAHTIEWDDTKTQANTTTQTNTITVLEQKEQQGMGFLEVEMYQRIHFAITP